MARKQWTAQEDISWDKKRGIKQGSKRDVELDRKRGVLDKPVMKRAHARARRK